MSSHLDQINAAAAREGLVIEPPMSVSENPTPKSLSIGDLINEELAPRETTYELHLSPRFTLVFRVISGYPEMQELKKNAAAAARRLRLAPSPELKEYQGYDPETAAKAFLVHHLSVECRINKQEVISPEEQTPGAPTHRWVPERIDPAMSFRDALKISKYNALVFEAILVGIDEHSLQRAVIGDLKEIENEGKG